MRRVLGCLAECQASVVSPRGQSSAAPVPPHAPGCDKCPHRYSEDGGRADPADTAGGIFAHHRFAAIILTLECAGALDVGGVGRSGDGRIIIDALHDLGQAVAGSVVSLADLPTLGDHVKVGEDSIENEHDRVRSRSFKTTVEPPLRPRSCWRFRGTRAQLARMPRQSPDRIAFPPHR